MTAYTILGLILLTLALPVSAEDAVLRLSRSDYAERLQGFWLGQNIANWTGLVTEMDAVGTPETLPFYTDSDWGSLDRRSVWGDFVAHSDRIAFYFEPLGTPWGADDDTDIEYLYSFLHHHHETSKLTAEQIRDGWLTHIYSETDAPLHQKFPDSTPVIENFLWVSNERARQLMTEGMRPPNTSAPMHNPMHSMIDAQLTTEIFGLLAPGRADTAQDIAYLPIRTTAQGEAAWIAQFYVVMHSLAARVDPTLTRQEQTQWLADQASQTLPPDSTAAKIYQFVAGHYRRQPDQWALTRDAIYQRYQLTGADNYQYQAPFDALINFAASLVSWFYGEGDIVRTIQIATLAGWDSDNPSATWGGLLGFMLGLDGVKAAFALEDVSNTYWIHRTRRQFPDRTPDQDGEDSFALMAARDLQTIDRVVVEQMGGQLDRRNDEWIIPLAP